MKSSSIGWKQIKSKEESFEIWFLECVAKYMFRILYSEHDNLNRLGCYAVSLGEYFVKFWGTTECIWRKNIMVRQNVGKNLSNDTV
jgi:hypothetical protein